MICNDKDIYFQHLEKFEIVPYTQTRGWCEMHSLLNPERIIFLVNDFQYPTIACFAHIKSFLGLKMLSIEGEAYRNPEACNLKNIKFFYKQIKELGYDVLEVNSIAFYNSEYEIALRQNGFLKPVGLFSMPLTKIIDLQKSIQYNQNWKRNLKKSEKHSLSFEVVVDASLMDCDDFLSIYAEMSNRKDMKFGLSKKQLFQLLLDKKSFQLFFVKTENHCRIATILIHRFKGKCGLLYAATGEKALETAASFFMYDELFKFLRDDGVSFFDMEKLVASTDDVNHVFNFKNGIKGEHKKLNGEWSWFRNKNYRPIMYFVKKYFLKRREI